MFKRLREGLFGPNQPEPETPPEEQPEQQGEASEPAPPAPLAPQASAPSASAPSASPPAGQSQRSTPAGSLRGPFAPPVARQQPQAPAAAAPSVSPTSISVSSAAPPAAAPAQVQPTAQPAAQPQSLARPAPQAAPAPTGQRTPGPTAQAAPVASPPKPEPRVPSTPPAQAGAPPRSIQPSPAAPVAPAPAPAPPQPPKPDLRQPAEAKSAPAAARPVEEEIEEGEAEEEQRGLFRNPFRFSLGRTRALFGRVNEALEADEEISDDLWDELEETLISSDVGVQTTERLMETLRERVRAEGLTHGSQLRDALKEELAMMLGDYEPLVFSDTSPISVYLVVGVNGVGKTTTIAKMASALKRGKHRVMLAAGDTFRAAATEQLKTWGERVGVPVIAHQHGADPGAVVFDAMQAAQARGSDVLIVDTAGRLHTKYNLMEELKKIVKVLQKYDPEAPHEVLLVIDATTGQNGFLQAKQFVQDAGVSGVVLTKLDGTARGGIVFAIAAELGLPIKYVGTGERVNDIAPFDPDAFVDALFEEE